MHCAIALSTAVLDRVNQQETWCLTSTETVRLIRDGLNQLCEYLLYTLHCETFWSSVSERFNITKSCKTNSGLNTDLTVIVKASKNIVVNFNLSKKKVNGVSTVKCVQMAPKKSREAT